MAIKTDHLDDSGLEAILELMFLAAQADGEFTADEREFFRKKGVELFAGKRTGEQLDELARGLEEDFFSYGREERLAMLKGILKSTDDRKAGLQLAIEMVSADGLIRTSERELLLDAAQGLDIDLDEAADMVKAATRA